MKLLRRLSRKPIIGPVAHNLITLLANREVKRVSRHFSQYLKPQLAISDELKDESYRIRHNVYCDELHFEPQRQSGMETDEFEPQSVHCLIEHWPKHRFAGTVRVVRSHSSQELLPLEKFCSDTLEQATLKPSQFHRDEVCEISRLAVPASYRRRTMDQYKGAETGVINEDTYSETELRCFPFIAVGLYLAAASVMVNLGIRHCFVMMEPRLARSMNFVGIRFQQVGPVTEYHGKRAPYYIEPEQGLDELNTGFQLLYDRIDQDLAAQVKLLQSLQDDKKKYARPPEILNARYPSVTSLYPLRHV
ncbi:hypothetical protein HMF8227_01188 [Saliniradius amylolyticus]|uniref:PEP-CTERM/exosortase system-associated acyltransferase n=1 Tax=Saliniradius amylolyticus TaxID=2183582 RepID=A0A2S2E245_9ALTE|nr:PEP-CTERM/exosortase system-associated acyltransferase [Saliniradius amylolyticus]AWL11669.1 hypothetical protein HMF8227_01188 [Saliniradius amylolyticus]